MDDPTPAAGAATRYDAAMLQVIMTLVTGMRRGGLLLDVLPERIADLQWRAEAIAEFGSWRTALETLPTEVPPGYTEVHAGLLRWAGAVEQAGDTYAAAIAARSTPLLRQANRQVGKLPARYAALNDALRRLAAAELE